MIRRPSSLQSRANAAPTKTSRGSSSRDIIAAGEARLRAQLIVDSLDRDRRIENAKTESLPSERLSAFDLLSTEELRELDNANLRERHIVEQTKRTLGGMASWLCSNPDFPSSKEAGEKIASYCQARGLNPGQWNNLDRAYAALLESGEIVQDFRKSNADAHEAHADALRANGIRVEAVDHGKMSKEEIEVWAGKQPMPLLADAFLEDTTPEAEYQAPHVPTFEDLQ
jgi:hypothetical protein